jgi:hypothetical protein
MPVFNNGRSLTRSAIALSLASFTPSLTRLNGILLMCAHMLSHRFVFACSDLAKCRLRQQRRDDAP